MKKTNQVAQNANLASENPPPKKKKGCLIASIILLLFVIGLAFGVSQIIKNPEKYGAVPSSSMTLKEFDSKSWEQYKTLYDAHNKLMNAMTSYSSGQGNQLDFYNYCKSSEEYFRKASSSFDYGTTDDEKTYLSVFENWALSDQLAAKSLMNYLDSLKTKDLSTAQEYIQSASDAAVTIASNRAKLLKDAGYTEDEIKQIIDNIPQELETASEK